MQISFETILIRLGLDKVYEKCVSRQLTKDQKRSRLVICHRFHMQGDAFCKASSLEVKTRSIMKREYPIKINSNLHRKGMLALGGGGTHKGQCCKKGVTGVALSEEINYKQCTLKCNTVRYVADCNSK